MPDRELRGHGGKRQGSGRKAGAVTTRTRAIADKIMQEGITPLEVMIDNMRTAYDLAVLTRMQLPDEVIPLDDAALALHLKYRAMAQDAATDAAPYIHPRLATMTVKGDEESPLFPPNIAVTFVRPGDTGKPTSET